MIACVLHRNDDLSFNFLWVMVSMPRITFGIIVLNGEPFIRYTLRALYPFAYEIIVVEGAVTAAWPIATEDGHSRDSTLATVQDFQLREDPEHKVILITAETEGHPNGFWVGEKDEQSRAYAKRANGEYLWQVDADEFYRPEDMAYLLQMLGDDSSITAVSFQMITFWGGFDYLVDGWYLRRGANTYHRLFKWGPGYQYVTHRPPTVCNELGIDVRSLHWVNGNSLLQLGIVLFHYSLLFPKQVVDKCEYYSSAPWAQRSAANIWAREAFLDLRRPFRVHNVYDYPSWLIRFDGHHPPEIEAMRRDIASGRLVVELRRTDDIERLLTSNRYAFARRGLQLWDCIDLRLDKTKSLMQQRSLACVHLPIRLVRKIQRIYRSKFSNSPV